MTGYGRGDAESDGLTIVVEISTFNRRNLETKVSVPKDWQSLERMIGAAVSAVIKRGRVQVSVQIQANGGSEIISWDDDEVAATIRKLGDLAKAEGIAFEPDASFILRLVTQHRGNHKLPEAEKAWPLVQMALNKALEEVMAMRLKEGAALRDDLTERNNSLALILEAIRGKSTGEVTRYRDNLLKRLRQVGLEIDLDDARVLKEIALFADRCDISEEIVRLESHIAQFSETLPGEEPIGRKLEFLLQEVLREFNTIGSKSNAVDISKNVLQSKNEIECIREQLQNVQ